MCKALTLGLILTVAQVSHASDEAYPPPAAENPAAPVDRPAIEIGSAAPALSIDKWLKGEPVAITTGRVYVIEFWATWCAPSYRAIPKLTDVQTALAPSGVTVIAIASQEHKGLAEMQKFLVQQGDRLGYTVAWDDEGKTAHDWMIASQTDRIPCAFIVDQNSRVAWIGHPLIGLDAALEQVLAGTFDREVEAVLARRARAVRSQTKPLAAAFIEADRAGDDQRALSIVDEILRLDPRINGAWSLVKFKLLAIEMKDPDDAFTFGRQCVESNINQNPDALLDLAVTILDQPTLVKHDPTLAVRAARRALQLTGQNSSTAHAILARAMMANGDRAGAVSHQQSAADLIGPGPDHDAQLRILAEYSAAPEEEDRNP